MVRRQLLLHFIFVLFSSKLEHKAGETMQSLIEQ